ncbi:putative holin [Klebsiella pneumoniae]|uniref:putative holin n=1 Tax=Klebsiella pneumoniae TaxID=573 RepID=UPI00312F401C
MSASSLTGDSLTQMLSFSSMAAVVAGVPPEVALGSLAGAVIFVTSAVEYPVRRRVLLSILSFLCGLLFYKPTASILIGVAAIVAVRVGIWLYHRSDNPRDLIPGGKDDDRS